MKKQKQQSIAMILLAAAILLTGLVPFRQVVAATGQAAPGDTSVTSTLHTGTKVALRWKKTKNTSGYLIYRKSGNSWKGIKNIRSSKTVKWVTSSLPKQQTHTFRVVPYRAVNGQKIRGNVATTRRYVPKVLKTSTATYSSTRQATIIRKAKTKLGSPYVLGTQGPNRFDCSGFTYWTFKNAGVKDVRIKRYSAQGIYHHYKKYSIGRSLSKAQPGDVLLFGYGRSKSRIFHVGIYRGNGIYIHATTGGRGVTNSAVPTGSLAVILRLKGLR